MTLLLLRQNELPHRRKEIRQNRVAIEILPDEDPSRTVRSVPPRSGVEDRRGNLNGRCPVGILDDPDPLPCRTARATAGRRTARCGGTGRSSSRRTCGTPRHAARRRAAHPQTRWVNVLQNDFAARADWSVLSYDGANHPPSVTLDHAPDLTATPGESVRLSGAATDPDGDAVTYRWRQYAEVDT